MSQTDAKRPAVAAAGQLAAGPARVLVFLNATAAWSRGIMRGFSAVAHQHNWVLLHYHTNVELAWLLQEWNPTAVVLGPEWSGPWPASLRSRVCVSVNADRSAEGIGSVCLDEDAIADAAFDHLAANGFSNLTIFRFDESPFAVARDRRFRQRAARAGARVAPESWVEGPKPSRRHERPAGITSWLRALPKPCGVFACCDSWSRVVARYALVAGLRVPEDLAIVGVDNDLADCELTVPPLSSVAIPWRRVGEEAAWLVRRALAGGAIGGQRVVVGPAHVVVRRSSDVLAIQDRAAATAVAWIRDHARSRLSVPAVARAARLSRQQLERRFRAALGRTVMEEIRRTRVELARRLLATTRLTLPAVAERSGLRTAALLNAAFRRELSLTPGAYRRLASGVAAEGDG